MAIGVLLRQLYRNKLLWSILRLPWSQEGQARNVLVRDLDEKLGSDLHIFLVSTVHQVNMKYGLLD